MQGSELSRVQGSELRRPQQGTGLRKASPELKTQGSALSRAFPLRAQGSECLSRAQQGPGLRAQGSGLGVEEM